MATIDDINILDRKPTDLELILESGRQPIAEPTPPSLSPVRDYFYENILNPEGRKLVDMVRGEVNNPLNFMAGASGISRVGGKGIATLRSKMDDGIGGGGGGGEKKPLSKDQLNYFTRLVTRKIVADADDQKLVRLLDHHKKRFAQNDEYLKRMKDKKILTNQDEINTYINQAKEEIQTNRSMITDVTKELDRRRKAKGFVQGEPMEVDKLLQIQKNKIAESISNRKQKLYKLQRELELEGGDMTPTVKKQTEQNIMRLMREINDLSK
jgi:hypothetical protein